jgi:phage virion morphogenesis protein
MSDGFRVVVRSDSVTPDLKRLGAMGDDMTPLMRAIGVAIVSLTKRAFNDASLRPAGWAAKKDGSVATLKQDAVLWRSIRTITADSARVVVGSDRPYAAIHQLGGKTRPMPARPYFPFDKTGNITARGDKSVRGVINGWMRTRGRVV